MEIIIAINLFGKNIYRETGRKIYDSIVSILFQNPVL